MNDHGSGPGTHPRATRYSALGIEDGASGPLRDVGTGDSLPVILSINQSGYIARDPGGTDPPPGSPLHTAFNGWVDFSGSSCNNLVLARGPSPAPGVVTYTVSGLDPSRAYVLQGGAVRGAPVYTNRWTLFELAGADGFISAHQGGLTAVHVGTIATNQVAINTGIQTGDMFEWREVNPGADGTIQIICTVYKGTVPAGSSGGPCAYALSALRIEEAFPTAPTILSSPDSQGVCVGASVTFSVAVRGYPLFYQWFRDDDPIPGAVSDRYVLTNVSDQDDGATFSVVVSNASGTAVSSRAQLRVITVGEALNCPDLVWTRNTNGPLWFPQTDVTHDGEAALQSGALATSYESSRVSTVVDGPGLLTFWWKLESTNMVSLTTFELDGEVEFLLSGRVDWRFERLRILPGSHTLTWSVWMAGAPAGNRVSAWLDQLSYSPGGEPPAIVAAPADLTVMAGSNAFFKVVADGWPPPLYQWQLNGQDLSGATWPACAIEDAQAPAAGTYTVMVSNDYGTASASARLTVEESGPVFLPQRTNLLTVPGGEVWLRAAVLGSEPRRYQWRFEDVPIPDATNQVLKLFQVGTAQVGRYSVVVSNSSGIGTSPDIRLSLTQVRHVLHISADGLGSRHLESGLRTDPDRLPCFQQLRREGSSTLNARCDYFVSYTVPNHLCILTGRPVLQPSGQPATVHHGYTSDSSPYGATVHSSGNPAVPYKASVFDVVHDRGLRTAFFAGKASLSVCVTSYDADHGAPDLIPPDHGRNKIDAVLFAISGYTNYNGYSDDLVDAVLEHLASGDPPHYMFLHLAEMDYAGHSVKWGSAGWFEALDGLDGLLGRLLSAIVASPHPAVAEQTVVILTADHGGGNPPVSHNLASDPLNHVVPLMAWGPGFPAGADLYSRFANRADPGTNWLDYDAIWPPLRNGDSGNLALQCLGLPPIPGSTLIPLLPTTTPALAIGQQGEQITISWSTAAVGFDLESTPALRQDAQWTTIRNGIRTNSTSFLYLDVAAAGARFYRLSRSPQP